MDNQKRRAADPDSINKKAYIVQFLGCELFKLNIIVKLHWGEKGDSGLTFDEMEANNKICLSQLDGIAHLISGVMQACANKGYGVTNFM
jgi:hypothetical protein